jgi:FkbM family methyltransferase
MENTGGFDSRIANILMRALKRYIFLRERRKKKAEHAAWARKFGDSNFILHSLGGELKMKLYRDSVLSSFIYEGFESDEIDFLDSFLNAGDCFIDIGANVGLYSLHASKRVGSNGTVIAFEPAEVTFKRLIENIQINDLKNIDAHKLGLSDHEALLELNISESGYEAWNTFVQSKDNKFSKKELVQVKTFDAFFEQNYSNVDDIALVKLDVEGFELNVLKGAKNLLSRERAPVFIVEFTDDNAIAAGHCCHEIYKLFNKYGYTWFRYDAKQKKLIYEPMRLNYPFLNLIAIKDNYDSQRLSKFRIQHTLEEI